MNYAEYFRKFNENDCELVKHYVSNENAEAFKVFCEIRTKQPHK